MLSRASILLPQVLRQGALTAPPSKARPFAAAYMASSAQEYDLVTIGAGSGGTRASRFAAQYYGAKVACIELPFGFVSSGDVGGAWGDAAGPRLPP